MFIADIAAILVTAGIGTLGTDLFIGALPPDPVNAVSVTQYGGGAESRVFGGSLQNTAMRRPRFQVLARNASAQAAFTKIEAARAALAGYTGTPGAKLIHDIVPVSEPGDIGTDGTDAYRVVQSFEAAVDP